MDKSLMCNTLQDFYSNKREIQTPVHTSWMCPDCDGGFVELAVNNSVRCTLLFNQYVVNTQCRCTLEGTKVLHELKEWLEIENDKQTEAYKKVTLRIHIRTPRS